MRSPSGSPFVTSTSEPALTDTSFASMVLFSSASAFTSTFTVKILSPSARATASERVTVTSAAAVASPSFVSSCQTLTFEMFASVPLRLIFMLLNCRASRLPSVLTLTFRRSCSLAPIEASAVLACSTSTPVTAIGFERYSLTVALNPL